MGATATRPRGWWSDAVVYQVYPRSFQDSDGSGEGDLRGIASRLDHLAWLGVDAIWLSPIYPSPWADGGYDVSDYREVHPRFGTLADADLLIAAAHGRGLRVVFDAVPCHTSIEHPWFTDHPNRYVFSATDGPANNWIAAFGGSAWSPDPGGRGWYLHSFYPEQPDLDWRDPEVPGAFGDALRFWLARGVDGFRVDAVDRILKDAMLRDDPPARELPRLPEPAADAALEHRHSRNQPDVGGALAALRQAGADCFLVGEAYVPSHELPRYLEHLDACLGFELFFAPWRAEELRRALRAAADAGPGRVAGVLSNHDFPRLPQRVGEGNVRAAAVLLTGLPGPVFLYQGDEIGMGDGPSGDPPDDRAGRDIHRNPMCWDPEGPGHGFTSGLPWLPVAPPAGGSVAAQHDDPDSLLWLYRDLLALRRELSGPLELIETAEDVVAYRRADHLVAINAGGVERPAPAASVLLRHTHRRDETAPPAVLGPGEGFLAQA
jgi:alpha-glucosidase